MGDARAAPLVGHDAADGADERADERAEEGGREALDGPAGVRAVALLEGALELELGALLGPYSSKMSTMSLGKAEEKPMKEPAGTRRS